MLPCISQTIIGQCRHLPAGRVFPRPPAASCIVLPSDDLRFSSMIGVCRDREVYRLSEMSIVENPSNDREDYKGGYSNTLTADSVTVAFSVSLSRGSVCLLPFHD